MNLQALALILISLVSYVTGQIFLKHAMELSHSDHEASRRRFVILLGSGIGAMTISFFLSLGLLQRFELSYLYPFQGLSVIMISIAAAVILKEKLTFQLTAGAILISLGIMLVSTS